jgi:hypothetical protein
LKPAPRLQEDTIVAVFHRSQSWRLQSSSPLIEVVLPRPQCMTHPSAGLEFVTYGRVSLAEPDAIPELNQV